ncbi:MAG: ATP-dependent helicase C-terminal domain-containing protein [Oligoflexales bacterium]
MKKKLPIDEHLQAISQLIKKEKCLIIEAAPGTGKTTRVPSSLLPIFSKKIIVVEPRRLAAKLSAARSAEELGEPCGQTVGYQVRFDQNTSTNTRLVYVTEGVLLKKLQSNPHFDDTSCILLDEFHERSLSSDLSLMLLRKAQTKNKNLKIIIMSATLDSQLLTERLKAPLISIPGRTFPVHTHYVCNQSLQIDCEKIAKLCQKMLQDPECSGHILIFLPGAQSIHDVAQVLSKKNLNISICKLYADLPKNEQNQAFQEGPLRKVILATNIAETSLTIPGITGVIDPGLAKISGYAHWSGMPTLAIQKTSQASMEQRAGRAGRTQTGLVYRMCTKDEFLRRPPHTPIDIQIQDLTSCLLLIHSLGSLNQYERTHIAQALPWLEPPHPKRLENAYQLLVRLDMLTPDHKLTAFGKKCAHYPFHPRIAAIAASQEGTPEASDALLAACVIQEGGVSRQLPRVQTECDVSYQMDSIKKILDRDDHWHLDAKKIDSIKKIFNQFSNKMPQKISWPTQPTNRSAIAKSILAGYPDRVAKRQKQKNSQKNQKSNEQYRYHFCLGRGGILHARSSLKHPEFIVAIHATEEEKKDAAKSTLITLACSISVEQLKDVSAMLTSKASEEIDSKTGEVLSTTHLYYGNCVIEKRNTENSNWSSEAMTEWLLEHWPAAYDYQILASYHVKRTYIREHFQKDLPEFKGEWLEILCSLLVEDTAAPSQLQTSLLKEKILECLTWEERQLLILETPDKIKAKNKVSFEISYTEQRTFIRGRIQDFYGLNAAPRIIGNKVALALEILAPNQRVCQITEDLQLFWAEHYPKLKSEFQRRYPRHHWAEIPQTALPIRHKSQLPPL